MKENSLKGDGRGITRRVFINRSISTAATALILSQAKAWPAWAEGAYAFEGTFGRMAKLAFDPEARRTWQSCLKVDLDAEEINTKWGPTRVTHASDSIMVKSRGESRYTKPYDVSAGMPDAKLDPRIDARGGKACVAWCACHPETRQWRIFAAYSNNGKNWSKPAVIAGGDRPALHPSVALDPDTGHAWIAYEDWSDGSIQLIEFDGITKSAPIKISESGKNFRPKVIITRKNGKHKGAVAVAWDAYRDYQYDIYLRMVRRGGASGPERRATRNPQWDSSVDMIEDLDGNIWLTWIRASNELSEMNAMRNVYTKFFDGKNWFYPSRPDFLYDPKEFATARRLSDRGSEDDAVVAEEIAKRAKRRKADGRITWFTVNWFPRLQVDSKNRVYLFYRQADPLLPPLYSHPAYQVYEGNRWSKQRYIGLNRGLNIFHAMWDFSTIVKDNAIEGVWNEGYLNMGKVFWTVRSTRKRFVPDPKISKFRVRGEAGDEPRTRGWPRRKTISPEHTIEVDGKRLTLLFGDTHTHSWTSDGADPADYYYHFARDYAKLDYFALSDHDFLICATPGVEAYISFLPKIFSEEDFICFQAYEFTSGAKGHRVVVFEGDDKPTFPLGVFNSQRRGQVNTVGQLYSFMHKFGVSPESRVLVTAHNMFQVGNDFSEYDESVEPLYDVTSLHITAEKTIEEYEAEGKAFGKNRTVTTLMNLSMLSTGGKKMRVPARKWFYSWRQCLDAAMPLGAYGTSDTHTSNGIGWVVSGLWVEQKNRKAIFDAMFKRHSIGLDNRMRSIDVWVTYPSKEKLPRDFPVVRMDIRFWLDNHFMGAKCKIDSPPSARAYAFSNDSKDPIKEIVIVKDGKEVFTAKGTGGQTVETEWRDDKWNSGRHYYYARVELASGNLGFSSPVFVNY